MTSVEELSKNIFHASIEGALGYFSLLQKQLPDLDHVIRDRELPMTPRVFLHKAMASFTIGHFYAAILVAGTAVEIGLREFMQQQFGKLVEQEKPKAIVSRIVDDIDFRKMVELCKEWGLLGRADDISHVLHECYNLRNKYSHGNLIEILGELANDPVYRDIDSMVQVGTVGQYEELRMLQLETSPVVHDDALKLIRLAGSALEAMRKFKI